MNVFESGELPRWSRPSHQLLNVGRRIRFRSGVESSLDCIESSMTDEDEELEDSAKSERDVGSDGRGGVEVVVIAQSLDDDGALIFPGELIGRASSLVLLLAILAGRRTPWCMCG